MATDFKNLKIDYKSLLKNTSISDRVELTKTSSGQQLLSALTPTDVASLFPDYYKKTNPDVSGFIEATARRYGRGKTQVPGAESAAEIPSGEARRGAAGGIKQQLDYKPSILQKLKETTKEDFTPESTAGKGIDRSRFANEMQNQDTRMRMYALAVSEVGAASDPASKRAIMETMFNRTDAQNRGSVSEIIAKHADPKANYYQPYMNGAFDRNMELLRRNPKLVEEMDSHLKEVLSGSNDANFATDNASGQVAANAMHTQTFTKKTGSGESLFIKNMDTPDAIRTHGAGVVANNKRWLEKVKKQVEDYQERHKTNIEQDPNANKILPDNINPQVKQYYDTLTQQQKDAFAIKMNKVLNNNYNNDIEKFNTEFSKTQKVDVPGKGMVSINPDRIIADVVQGKRSPEDSMVEQAMTMKGINEKKDRDELMRFLSNDQKSLVDPSKSAWCSSFVNSSLASVGIKGTGDPGAYTWHEWGETVSDKDNVNPEAIRKGDVYVNYEISKNTGKPGSHVGIVTGPAYKNKDGNWVVPTISGNTGRNTNTVEEKAVRVNSNAFKRAPLTEQYYDKNVLETVNKAKQEQAKKEAYKSDIVPPQVPGAPGGNTPQTAEVAPQQQPTDITPSSQPPGGPKAEAVPQEHEDGGTIDSTATPVPNPNGPEDVALVNKQGKVTDTVSSSEKLIPGPTQTRVEPERLKGPNEQLKQEANREAESASQEFKRVEQTMKQEEATTPYTARPTAQELMQQDVPTSFIEDSPLGRYVKRTNIYGGRPGEYGAANYGV